MRLESDLSEISDLSAISRCLLPSQRTVHVIFFRIVLVSLRARCVHGVIRLRSEVGGSEHCY